MSFAIMGSKIGNLNIMDCLSLLPGTCCPHYDSEAQRRPTVHNMIKNGKINECYAVEDGAAIHFKEGKLHASVGFYKGAQSYIIKDNSGSIVEEKISSINIF